MKGTGKFGSHSGGVTPKDQSSHGKAKGQTEKLTPPQKKGEAQIKGMPPAQTPK